MKCLTSLERDTSNMALDTSDYDLFKEIRNVLKDIAKELHIMNETRNKTNENASLT